MAVTISAYVAELAQMVSQATGLDQNVVLAHWNAEEGVGSANWPNNNPAGIRPGNSAVDKLAVGVNSYGFDIFPSPAAGAQAYATLINTDVNYAGVRTAAKTGNPIAQLQAIVQSPWDEGHYGGDGHLLYQSYTAITGKNVTITADSYGSNYTYPAMQDDQTAINNQISFPPTNYSVVANSQRTGDILYGRRYRIIVSNKSGIALDVSDLHVSFDVVKTINQQPNYSTVVIYNLNPTTENFIILEGDHITIEAGYVGSQYGVIFDGDIILPIRDKADNVTYRLTLYALDSHRQLNQAFANFTLNKGQSARSLIENLASKTTVPTPLGFISDKLSTTQLPRGKAVFGLARDYLRQIAQTNSMAFYAENGEINFIHATDLPQGEIFDLTPASGLIGEPAQQDLGVAFRCLLNPRLTINSFVHIDSSLIQAQAYQIGQVPRPLDSEGIYRVISVEHSGDTRDTNWYTGCVTVSQAGGIPGSLTPSVPGMISTTTASPW
ncbi:phage protein [Alicyclobacillus macrosporangiidus]|uniref:Mannosyl-glycoprotein endo-beta-N-acetylglucosaminidase n=1 Tax=Alicyclobacillus macrosporangiidus TaxID=392015 RepID=A0A1I7IE86_9BACL|nr:glucosaminidase domain-containing protein [Alicyclobacillus macrosporangiidus]SFU71247.1 Mannosyl-glycoprotein endo-beta-N-acetylglucosaminidase [Alicyclobacillus macrosporangiidus]